LPEKALCGDIGGTNANLCIADYSKRISISGIERKSTADYTDFSDLITNYLQKIGLNPTAACFAVAGPVQNQRVIMTNANLVIDAEEISKKTGIANVLIINDFDAVGFATNVLEPTETKVINTGRPLDEGLRAAVGAGTGLGKNILIYDKQFKSYFPYSSEGGHADFPILFPEESFLFEYFNHPTYEDLLSGRGLESLYQALQKSKYLQEIPTLTAKEISAKRNSSPICRETFEWFVKFYARCAKNFAIDLMAKGGLFLAGGIAAANSDQFGEVFLKEFTRHALPQFREMLKEIPVILITNYGVSLKGAAFALRIRSPDIHITDEGSSGKR
jgi:glucokinase